ncbi:MAG: DUF1538 domain-containing protein [Spirochaetia bacterium]|jgi:hypothetical protein|nr:DUF1538 domain-containing protein [Spirochaetia bacterium]
MKSFQQKRVRIPFNRAFAMVAAYTRSRLGTQARSVAFVVVYLLLTQTLVFRVPIREGFGVVIGIAATVAGLACFLEGLFLGIMPLGEQSGLGLPGKAGPALIALFSVVLGITATLAEPAIGILKVQGGAVLPWDAPVLYLLLNRGSTWLVWAVSAGVGIAVALGMFRFLFGWSFKPFVFILIPVLVAATFILERIPALKGVMGLAWDTGGVTTGPVTVPLVIALGVGLSRIVGAKKGGASGLGVVTLASALPVVAVMALAAALSPLVPDPGRTAGFFSPEPETRRKALFVAGSERVLGALALEARDVGLLEAADFDFAFPEGVPFADDPDAKPATQPLAGHFIAATKAVLPLALVLVAVLVVFLRQRIRGMDEVVLGLIFAVAGMFLFNLGMERGLAALGSQAGAALPKAYEETLRVDRTLTVRGVSSEEIVLVAGPHGPGRFVWIQGPSGAELVPFIRENWTPETGEYRHVPVESAVFSAFGRFAGFGAVLVFVFILGLGATLAEPSLSALGSTVEDLTTGTYSKITLMRTVALGVGLGLAVGFGRILFDLPLFWILGPPYAAALVLTWFSSEEFSAIAWDAAGVTTGPVTVPLVIATGLGLGAGASVSFGVVAAASVFPVLAVLVSGLANEARARRSVAMEVKI